MIKLNDPFINPIITKFGDKYYYSDGTYNFLNRSDGPAVEYANGSELWYKDGFLHREDGPAISSVDGSKEWFLNGRRHREGGPALIRNSYENEGFFLYVSEKKRGGGRFFIRNSYEEWYHNGKLHRLDGPATQWRDKSGTMRDNNLWYYNGKQIECKTQQEFERLIKLIAFL